MKEIIKRLKYAMEILGVSDREIEEQTGVPRPTYRNIVRGNNKPRLDTIAKIAQTYDLSIDWLTFGGDDETMFRDLADDDDFMSDRYLKRRWVSLDVVKASLNDHIKTSDKGKGMDKVSLILKDLCNKV